MKKSVIILTLLMFVAGFQTQAQRYFTRNGQISFFSSTPVENIEAHNKTVSSIFDIKTGKIEFAVTMKSFHFEKALMEEHFNENYVESDEYPKATFKGEIVNLKDIDFSKNGMYDVVIKGNLTMHGVTREITVKGTFQVQGENVKGEAEFTVVPEDYDIEIPGVVRDKIAKEIMITVIMNYKLLKK